MMKRIDDEKCKGKKDGTMEVVGVIVSGLFGVNYTSDCSYQVLLQVRVLSLCNNQLPYSQEPEEEEEEEQKIISIILPL